MPVAQAGRGLRDGHALSARPAALPNHAYWGAPTLWPRRARAVTRSVRSRDRIPRRAETSWRHPKWPQQQQSLIWPWCDWRCTDSVGLPRRPRLATVSRVQLQQRIADRMGEFLIFAVTPPRQATGPEETRQIAEVTLARLRSVGIDGLVLYDIDDESDRNPNERPFPFLPTMDPAEYLARDLVSLDVPAIVYRAVSKHSEDALRLWLRDQDPARALSVFVGASSREKVVTTSLSRAYELRTEVRPDLPLGGVAIPERHARGGNEHLRLIAKQAAGCSFFVTQVVYDVNAAKDLVSDYHYACAAQNLEPVPIVFTFSVCGSMKTLEFLQWLGVDVPRWIANDLRHADDTLDASYDQAVATAIELIAFCRRVGVPFGLNVESVSIRKVEIEASVRLAARLRAELRR
jgi:hypothetical protein